MNARYNKNMDKAYIIANEKKYQILSTPPIQSILIVLIGYNEKKEEGKANTRWNVCCTGKNITIYGKNEKKNETTKLS